MPLLAYCLSELVSVNPPQAGVGGLRVEALEQEGVRCFYSQSSTRDQILGLPARQTALAFHDVVHQIFRQIAVIPFRFPTMLEEMAEVGRHLEERGSAYRQDLARLRNLVQMEIYLSLADSADTHLLTQPKMPGKGGGTQYLQVRQSENRRLSDSAAIFQQAACMLNRGWKDRASGRGQRCFILVERNAVSEFKTVVLQVRVLSGIAARISGPWPASEFVTQP